MWLTIRKSLLAQKVRLSLTALAVVLGVAFVSGTLVLTDTMRGTFDELMASAYGQVDVAIQGPEEFGSSQTGETARAPVDAGLLDHIAGVEGVAELEGEVQGEAQLLGPDGEQLGLPNAPSLAGQSPLIEELYAVELRDGVYPDRPGEVAIDAGTAKTHDLVVGDQVDVVAGGPVTSQTIVGIVGYGETDNLAGATLTVFDPDTAFELFAVEGSYRSINVLAEAGVERDALADRIEAEIGGDWQVLTGEEMSESAAAAVSEGLGFLSTALLVFAGISLFVGGFIIFNTFSIIVAQRTRELALLRAVGASRWQVVTLVLIEALATGLFGSVVGIGLGLGVAVGLRTLMDSFGLSLPEGELVFAPRTVIVGLLVGVVVTTVAALGPALRSLRVPPVAAMQAVAGPSIRRAGRARTIAGGGFTLVGVLALAGGLFADAGIPVVALGAVLVILGFSLLSALITRPILRVLGWPVDRTLGVRGQLATQNALRNPRRTASTASALMIGLGLVSFVMIFGASITSSSAAAIEDSFRAEFTVRSATQGPGGFSPEIADVVADVDGVETVMPMRYAEFKYDDQVFFGTGLDPETFAEVIVLEEVAGSIAALDDRGVAVKASIAEDEGWQIGDVVEIEFAATGVQRLELQAIVDGDVDVSWFFADAAIQANLREAPINQLFVKLADRVGIPDVRPSLEAALKAYPTVEILDRSELQEDIEGSVDQILGLMTALLVLSVIIALFGLVNTLGLSVFERTSELGLLRAVGASQRQIRAMVRWEAVLISTLGATLGLGIGSLFGWMLVRALANEGISRFTMPGTQLGGAFAAAAPPLTRRRVPTSSERSRCSDG